MENKNENYIFHTKHKIHPRDALHALEQYIDSIIYPPI